MNTNTTSNTVDTSLLTKTTLSDNTWFHKNYAGDPKEPPKFKSDLFREFIAWASTEHSKYIFVLGGGADAVLTGIAVYAPTTGGNELLGTIAAMPWRTRKGWSVDHWEDIVVFRNRRIEEDMERGNKTKRTTSLTRAKSLFRKYFYPRSLSEILVQSTEVGRYYTLYDNLPIERDATPYDLCRDPALWKFLLDREDELAAAFDNPAQVREAFAKYRTGEASNAKLQEFKDTHVAVVPYGDKYIVSDAKRKDISLRSYEELPEIIQYRYSILALRNSSCETATPNYVEGLGITNGKSYLVDAKESNDE